MTISGLQATNLTQRGISDFARIANDHVKTYWNDLFRSPYYVGNANTSIIGQMFLPGEGSGRRELEEAMEEEQQHASLYDYFFRRWLQDDDNNNATDSEVMTSAPSLAPNSPLIGSSLQISYRQVIDYGQQNPPVSIEFDPSSIRFE